MASSSHGVVTTTIAFSSAGHLLAYHLGFASVLRRAIQQRKLPPLSAVAGSSSGAIAAALLSQIPHRLDEYTQRFLQDRGRAFSNFQQMLQEEEEVPSEEEQEKQPTLAANLYVCVTKSEDGSPHLFEFPPPAAAENTKSPPAAHHDRLLKAIEASCRIPISFHPLDMFQSAVTYEKEGIEIDGSYYCDGGISGIFPPPTPMDLDTSKPAIRILVCPIALGGMTHGNQNNHVICPSLGASSRWSWLKTRDGVSIQPSFQNLQSLVVAGGLASSDVLESWYNRGKNDANRFLLSNDWSKTLE